MKIRVSAVQYPLKTIQNIDEFKHYVEHYIKTAKEFNSEYILFPEFLTTQLLSIGDEEGKAFPISYLPRFTNDYQQFFSKMAGQYQVYIIGGTHITERNGHLYNTAHLFHPDGKIDTQDKLHITPTEFYDWNIKAGDKFQIFEAGKLKVAILTCYDIEFPELSRMARAKGADIIFCPSCTDDRHGFHRVRYTSHARAIENQIYVVLTGTIGSLPTVDFMRANFGQAAIITPNDLGFPMGGILDEGMINQDMIITADLDFELLQKSRQSGSVSTWQDRRLDFYEKV